MGKITALLFSFGYLISAKLTFANNHIINIQRPQLPNPTPNAAPIPVGFANLSQAINNIVVLAFIIALIIVLIMLIWGAIEWIIAGGDKEGLANARNKIINALIGLVILAVAFAIFSLASTFVGIDPNNLVIPTPPSP